MQRRLGDQIIPSLAGLYDRCTSDKQQRRLEVWTVWLAVAGFLVHLALIALACTVPFLNSGLLADLDRNYLHAVYTPFSFILFYEVLLLVTVFRRVSLTVVHSPPHQHLPKFVAIKKSVAVLLCRILLFLAAFNVLHWASEIIATPGS